jgi:hypothetical protein
MRTGTVLLRHAYKFWGRAAAGFSKSTDCIFRYETPLRKNRSDATGDFKN